MGFPAPGDGITRNAVRMTRYAGMTHRRFYVPACFHAPSATYRDRDQSLSMGKIETRFSTRATNVQL